MIDQLPERYVRIYAAIGLLSVNWATAEYALDHIIRTVHDKYGGDQFEPEAPASYNRKPTYLRKAFKAHTDLVQHLPRLNELLKEASQIAEQRSWCMHGFLDGLPGTSSVFPISKIIHGPEYRNSTRPFTVRKIEALAHRATILSLNLIFFGAGSVWIESQDGFDKIVRELLRKKGTTLPPGNLFR